MLELDRRPQEGQAQCECAPSSTNMAANNRWVVLCKETGVSEELEGDNENGVDDVVGEVIHTAVESVTYSWLGSALDEC